MVRVGLQALVNIRKLATSRDYIDSPRHLDLPIQTLEHGIATYPSIPPALITI